MRDSSVAFNPLGAIDLELTVQRAGGVRQIEVTKGNATAEGQKLTFQLRPIPADDGSDVITAEAAFLSGVNGTGSSTSSPLPRDAQTALEKLTGLSEPGSIISLDRWRDATFEAFGDRPKNNKRQAWSKSHRLLIERGFVAHDGENVSVSEPSADRQQCVSADGGKASARGVSAPLLIEEGADVADAPRHQPHRRRK